MRKRAMILGIIPARGGSKALPGKNVKRLAGKPLICYTIDAALKASTLDKVIVSTDSRNIARLARKSGAEVPFLRPKYLAQDDTPMVPVAQHAVRSIEKLTGRRVGIVVLLQPTSPLRTPEDIDAGVRKLLRTKADSVISVCRLEYLSHPYSIKSLKGDKVFSYLRQKVVFTRRQEIPDLYRLNAALYIVRRDTLIKKGTFFGKDMRAVIMEPARSIDIDSRLDFEIAEFLLRNIRRIKVL